MKKHLMNTDYDVAVCGGGFAGISAALAAAREGRRVVLFEKQYMLGGLGTAGLCTSVNETLWDVMRVIPCCAVTGQAAGTAAAMTSDFSALNVQALQERLRKNGVVLHESELCPLITSN